MDNMLVLEMPVFRPQYKKSEKYGYKKVEEKNNLKKVLENSSEGYCMYCYTRIRVDGKLYANLEHAIEKKNSKKLVECIPNIGLTCSVCNQIFKKSGETKRRLPDVAIKEYETESKCSLEKREQCAVPCRALKKLQKQYNNLPEGNIILQPMGVEGEETGEMLTLQYDVLKMEFQPATSFHTYSEKEISFIENHIRRFRLNDPEYKTRKLFEFIRNIINNDGKIPQYEYNNLIVQQFCKQIQNKDRKDILKICKTIFFITFPKM
ncbi:MAG: hypothetical protein ACI4HI_05060 [Lachnospiraceae bacterium]